MKDLSDDRFYALLLVLLVLVLALAPMLPGVAMIINALK